MLLRFSQARRSLLLTRGKHVQSPLHFRSFRAGSSSVDAKGRTVKHEKSRSVRDQVFRGNSRVNKALKRIHASETVASSLKSKKDLAEGFPPSLLQVEISCHPGLESVLSRELDWLQVGHTIDLNRHIAKLKGISLDTLMKCQLWLGSASQISIRCGAPFTARVLAELGRKVERLPWNMILNPGTSVNVKVTMTYRSKLLHTTAIRDRILDGIRKSMGSPEIPSDKESNVNLHVRVIRDQIYLSLATSTTPLHKRGYRLEPGKAPLREDMAYALLHAAGWSHEDINTQNYTAFLDPFCGSGTLAIEAACIARGLPPGRLRDAPLVGTTLFKKSAWPQLVEKAISSSVRRHSSIEIACSDRNAGAVKIAAANIARAGIQDIVDVRECGFRSHPWLNTNRERPRSLLLAGNLPFGRRTRNKKKQRNRTNEFLPLYQSVANVMNSYRDAEREYSSKAMLLSDDANLIKRCGFKGSPEERIRFIHGGIPVSGWWLFDEQD